jgi:hypothetical protein
MAKQLIGEAHRHGPLRRKTKFWTPHEFLLLQPPILNQSRLLKMSLKRWSLVFLFLQLEEGSGVKLPSSLTLLQIFLLESKDIDFQVRAYNDFKLYAQSRRFCCVQDFVVNGRWGRPKDF